MVKKGVIFVASSGNGACSNCVGNPWVQQSANVLIVSATTSTDTGESFNSKGSPVDISAPGVGSGSAGGPNTNSYHIMDGSSMACPYVAGVAALIKTMNPTFTRAQVESPHVDGRRPRRGRQGRHVRLGPRQRRGRCLLSRPIGREPPVGRRPWGIDPRVRRPAATS